MELKLVFRKIWIRWNCRIIYKLPLLEIFMEKELSGVRILLGIIFIILGVLGLFLPILQGILFLILGAGFLGYPIPERYLNKIRFGRSLKTKKTK